MKKLYIKSLITLAFICGLSQTSSAQITVTDGLTAQQLVNYLVGDNVAILNPILNCPQGHSGTFETISSNLGIDGGIVLSTGSVKTDQLTGNVGVNSPVTAGQGNSNPNPTGDPDLSALSGKPTHDACILEFDFVPDVDSVSTLRFKYVFGSEEYPNYTCSIYNDVFGFLITGPGLTSGTNIALVPGTNIPVAVNSINSGVPSGGNVIDSCNVMGPGSPFPAFFVNNAAVNGQTVVYDGFTVKLEANAVVYPCDTYHMKLGVANAWDNALQSGVFLQKNSFSVDTVVFHFDGIIASDSGYLVEGCTPAQIVATRSQATTQSKKLCLSYGGTAINGVDYPMLPDTLVIGPGATLAAMILNPYQDNIAEPGFETIVIRRLNCCTLEPIDSVTVKVRDSLKMELLSTDTLVCGKDTVLLHATGDPSFTYSWTPPADVVNPSDTMTLAFPSTSTLYKITASFSGCPPVSRSFNAFVEPVPQVNISPNDTTLCLASPFQLNVDVQPSSYPNFNYFWAPHNGIDDPYAQSPHFFYDDAGTFRYILTVQSPNGCTGSDSVTITTRPGVELLDVTPDQIVKYGSSLQLNSRGAEFYVWLPDNYLDYPNTATPTATPLEPVDLTLIGYNHWGCKDTAYVKLGVDYTMNENVPSAFTPNGDGLNDVFKVGNMKFQKLLEFRVFNRWGQEVFSTYDPQQGWDGTYKGEMQETGVYHYIIRVAIPDGKTRLFKGDVTLIH